MEETSQNKKRHIIVTLYLILTILVDTYGVYSSFFGETRVINNSNISSKAIMIIFGILGILDIFLIILILKWSKNAFLVICGISIITFFINMFTGVGLTFSLFGLSGLLLLFGILQIKYNQKSAWENLE